jgi:hypothetical protein
VILFALLFVGCNTVHEFPDDKPVNPSLVEVDVKLSIDTQFYADAAFQTYTGMTTEENHDIRYIVDIYEERNGNGNGSNGLGERIARIVKTETGLIANGIYDIQETLKLPPKKYRLVTWIDFVDKGTENDKHHNTADLQKVSIIPQNDRHIGYHTTRDAFNAVYTMDLTPYSGQRYVQYTVEKQVQRPFALYRIISTDMESYRADHQRSYASARPVQTNLSYNLFFPLGYDAHRFSPGNFTAGVNYSHNIVDASSGQEAVVASNFVFMGDNTFYLVDFEILSADGNVINTIKGLRINLRRNHITIIRGEFLTGDLNTDGIGIDDRFTEEIIIPI